MKRLFLYFTRLATIIMAMAAIVLSIPPISSLYFMLFKGAQPGDSLSPDVFVLPLYMPLALLVLVVGLLCSAYVADRFVASRLRALA